MTIAKRNGEPPREMTLLQLQREVHLRAQIFLKVLPSHRRQRGRKDCGKPYPGATSLF